MSTDPKDIPGAEREYVLGTHREEVERLGLQHRLWRPYVLESWERAGFGPGQTLVDVGSGPGHATFDLAEVTGPHGRVVAVDQSARFLQDLRAGAHTRSVTHVHAVECDITRDEIPVRDADGAWVRWVLCFVPGPRAVLERILHALRPGGTIVMLDYFDYESWRFARETPAHDRFRDAVVESWRGGGGNPDVGLEALRWLREMDCEVTWTRTVTELIRPADPLWQWAATFIRGARGRLVAGGFLSEAESDAVLAALEAAEADPETIMITPGVVQIVARKPR